MITDLKNNTKSNIDEMSFSGWSKKGLIKELEHLDGSGKQIFGLTSYSVFSSCLELIRYYEEQLDLTETELSKAYDEIGELRKIIKTKK